MTTALGRAKAPVTPAMLLFFSHSRMARLQDRRSASARASAATGGGLRRRGGR